MSTWQERIRTELSELSDKRHALAQFVETREFQNLTPKMQVLLDWQLRTMTDYMHILQQRIAESTH